MFINNTQIKKAFLGGLQLTSKNAFIGNYRLIKEDEPEPVWDGLTFTAEKAGSTVTYVKSTVSSAEYSYDTKNWSDANGVTITLNNVGDKVYFRGLITGNQDRMSLNYAHFGMTGLIAASGNINSLNNDSDVLSYSRCYEALFEYCTSLTQAPELPATTLSGACYHFIFLHCTSLTQAPELPATTLVTECYDAMFYGCTSLTQAPELPATTLASHCYDTMFNGCTSLTTAPSILPATTLTGSCYWHMFNGCTSLTQAPELPATALIDWCYGYMFKGCTSLNNVTTYATSWNTSRTSNWLNNVSATGDFYNLGEADIPTGPSGIPEGWTEHKSEPVGINYFYYENADTVPATFSQVDNYGNQTFLYKHSDNVEYSFDKNNWDSLITTTTEEKTITVDCDEIVQNHSGLFIWIRKSTSALDTAQSGWNPENCEVYYSKNSFTFDAKDTAYKAIYLDKQLEYSSYTAYLYYFKDVDVTDYEWNNMFYVARYNPNYKPEAFTSSATNLASKRRIDEVVSAMPTGYYASPSGSTFTTVSNLSLSGLGTIEVTRVITEKTLADVVVNPGQKIYLRSEDNALSIDNYSFGDACQLLYFVSPDDKETRVKYNIGGELYTLVNYNEVYDKHFIPAVNMFADETNLIDASKLVLDVPLGYLNDSYGCYLAMFGSCTSLTKAPELPATTLANNCYEAMFGSCTSLTKAPELPATTLANNCYEFMFYGCTSLTQAPELPAPTLASYCYSNMFNGCTSLTTAPELPATTLTAACYYWMFYGCTSLTTAPELPAKTLANNCYNNMFYGCKSLTKSPVLPAKTLANYCYNNMFYGCTSLTEVTTYATEWNTSYTSSWLNNVSATGDFYNFGMASISRGESGIPSGWTEYWDYGNPAGGGYGGGIYDAA